ncbi:MAG TPA: phosphate ABC transporter permease, partial [Pseudomonadales bacterium]|nr:phosphate ABC transporter permease [Pseudomonadales bacterium]
MDQLANSPKSVLSGANIARIRARRHLTDKIASRLIAMGGVSVILAVCLIFFYLVWEVVPLFRGASISPQASFQAPSAAQTYYVDVDESVSVALQLTAQSADFFSTADGKLVKSVMIGLPPNSSVTSFTLEAPETQLLAFGLSNGAALIMRSHYDTAYEGAKAVAKPTLRYPFGETPVQLSDQAIQTLALRDKEDALRLAWVDANNVLAVRDINKVTAFMSDELSLEPGEVRSLPHREGKIDRLFISPNQRWLYALDFQQGVVDVYDLNQADPQLAHVERVSLTRDDGKITAATLLNGGVSLIVGTEKGRVHQWFQVRDDNAGVSHLNWIRSFDVSKKPVVALAIEQRRKGFVAADTDGEVAFYNATSEKEALNEKLLSKQPSTINLAPRANALVTIDAENNLNFFHVDNEHPEVSWRSLWAKVWYENYPEPTYTWQSSSANTDFEPKFSLVPLTFGTLKAAFYSMLLSIPLAVFGAMFTAYFMAPSLRTKVKPAIEVMGSMPTVILGFLAGLWLAPMAEEHLPGLFAL